MTYIGNEQFSVGDNNISITTNDFWRWAYSDLSDNFCRSVLAEFIIATSLEVPGLDIGRTHLSQKSYDILTEDGYKVEVKSAAYVQSLDSEHPDCITFGIAPLKTASEIEKNDIPHHRHSDVFIFCIYKAVKKDDSPLNLDLWDFYILPTKVLDEKKPTQKTITLPSLMQLEPIWCDYYGIGDAIQKAMTA